MKATIRDSQALEQIRPHDLERYLAAHDWTHVRPFGDYGAIYRRIAGTRKEELLVPLTREIDDFPQRIADILRTLESVEDRSQLEILNDLATANADVIRVRRGEAEDGTLPLEDAATVFPAATEILLAAACTAISPRFYYQGKRPGQALEYVHNARLGQTERGSYVLTIISPLPPPKADTQQSLFGPVVPFERQVTVLLSNGLSATMEASEYALRTASTDHFRDAAKDGISANLLDAVLGLMGTHRHEIGVNFAWSPGIAAPEDGGRMITIEPDFAPVIEEASKFLKTQEPLIAELTGVVIALRRPQGMENGRITLLAFVDGKPRNVTLELAPEYYDQAITAHRNQRPVLCEGELVRLGRVTVLRNIRNFNVAPELEDADRNAGIDGPLFTETEES